jgi:hypothetical protein
MTEPTPLQRLDDAVHAYTAATDPDGNNAALGGWVLAFQTSYIEDNGPSFEPITWAGNYAVSPGLSPFAAAGLATHVNNVIHRIYTEAQLEGPDEDR